MTRKLADVVIGVAGGLVVFAAVPSVLALLVGDPMPRHWTPAALLSLHGLFELLSLVAWGAWVTCAWSLLRSVVARVRTCDTSLTPRLVDQLAVRIAVAILAVAPAGIASASDTAGAATRRAPSVTAPPFGQVTVPRSSEEVTSPSGIGVPTARQQRPSTARHGHATHVVVDGESLWHIAATRYGDGSAWRAIAAANLGRMMGEGARFMDPSHARAGWAVAVPSLDTSWPEHPGPPSPDGRVPSTAPRTISVSRRHGSGPPTPGGGAAALPELAALGVGSLVAALLARRARETRRFRALSRPEGAPTPLPLPAEVVLSASLAPFERSPLLHWVEAGLSCLTVAARERRAPLPAVHWLRAGSDGLDVHFAAEPPPPTTPWVVAGPAAWRLPASFDPASAPVPADVGPWCPVVVPVGEDEDTTWLLPVSTGGCLGVLGPLAGQMVHAMQVAASRWRWHEALVVTTDVATVVEAVRVRGSVAAQVPGGVSTDWDDELAGGPYVLFVGDPRPLPDHVRARCAVLTTEPSVVAEASVLVDRRGATIHPYGVALRPHLLDGAWAGPIAQVAPPAHATREGRDHDTGTAGSPHAEPRTDRDGGSSHRSAPLRHYAGSSATAQVTTARASLAQPEPQPGREREPHPGPVETAGPVERTGRTTSTISSPPGAGLAHVRLLVSVPRIDDLRGELPPKRARRATELIAYLALHHPEPVTGDRLRTRVLGSADTDAAAKTLFNTAHAARRALGHAPDGTPLLPPATRTGQYRISPLVTLDARRAGAMIEVGLAGRGAESLALLERALSLIEAEPLGSVLTGYGWWLAEGHERHFADLVVDGACTLCRGAIAVGQVDRARWAIARARQVEIYSEALTRAAMEVAAASGDAARLRAEWLDYRRQVDELDPGGMPSTITERLYGHLRAQLGGEGRPREAAPAQA